MDKKNLAVSSLVFSVLAVICAFFFVAPLVYLILALVGLILGFMGAKSEKKGVAIVGIVLSILVFVWFILITFILAPIIFDVFNKINSGLTP